jgi:hypothetical protein
MYCLETWPRGVSGLNPSVVFGIKITFSYRFLHVVYSVCHATRYTGLMSSEQDDRVYKIEPLKSE